MARSAIAWSRREGWRTVRAVLVLGLGLAATAPAQIAKQGDSELDRLTLEFPAVTPATAGQPLAESDSAIASEVASTWNHFRQSALGEWSAFVDPRNGRIGYVEGSGLPWVPGYGNSLRPEEIAAPRRSRPRCDRHRRPRPRPSSSRKGRLASSRASRSPSASPARRPAASTPRRPRVRRSRRRPASRRR